MNKSSITLKNLILSAMFLALCMVLPFLTGQIGELGQALSPMHIPVLLCGFVCGGPWGMVVGFVAPLLRFALFGMPPIWPVGVAMAFEMAVYGLLAGVLYRLLPKKIPYIYLTLVVAMLIGRVVWGLASLAIAGINRTVFTFSAFLGGAFITAIPGIILHIILIPVIIIALRKAKLMPDR